jgi:hypothetical protein
MITGRSLLLSKEIQLSLTGRISAVKWQKASARSRIISKNMALSSIFSLLRNKMATHSLKVTTKNLQL